VGLEKRGGTTQLVTPDRQVLRREKFRRYVDLDGVTRSSLDRAPFLNCSVKVTEVSAND